MLTLLNFSEVEERRKSARIPKKKTPAANPANGASTRGRKRTAAEELTESGTD